MKIIHKSKTIIVTIVLFIIIFIIVYVFVSRESFQRYLKDLKSDYTGGIERTIKVYDYNGNVLETYEGKIDVDDKENGTTKFDLDGKRTIIKGGIVVIQEN